ncbi:MAG: hypothetical protein GWN18_13735, partial [Thermoplasmata archaeon]|nr:hypothetical protein [Thermoplasmata archaeon]NIS13123.1 hypothetical protein [Thermoplasmata archaeon]NIS21020.1 hypothetical protein [Thermoplasmata archaeon]NIT78481.1 hypothetical protein [Thermoplasmata archaeon]NIU50075.1 hypothetical protein [Thermoplasmata archaeon]
LAVRGAGYDVFDEDAERQAVKEVVERELVAKRNRAIVGLAVGGGLMAW